MKTQTANNVLIAEFIGASLHDKLWLMEGHGWFEGSHLRFHEDWNWLMPVVEKINDFPVQGKPEIRIGLKTHVYYSPLTKDGEREQKLSASFPGGGKESVYQAVLQFIKWYNENEVKSYHPSTKGH